MAENKKSFLLYCDLIHTINQLPNDKAGELFKHILEYVNDNNPTTKDLLINISFEPIKQQLKRDLRKFEGIVERNKLNGAKGGRPKKPKKPTGLNGNPKKPKKADSDNDNDINIYTPPKIEEFLTYCVENIAIDRSEYLAKKQSAILKYKSWEVDDWHKTISGKRTKIKNWKTTILNTWKYL